MSGIGGVVVRRISTRMAPATAGSGSEGRSEGLSRTTFAVGKLTWKRSEIRLVERRREGARTETVH